GDVAQAQSDVADGLDDRLRVDPVFGVVGDLDLAAAIGFVHRGLHRRGDAVGVHDYAALDVAGRPSDHLNERALRPEIALFVRVEDRDEGDLGKVDALA